MRGIAAALLADAAAAQPPDPGWFDRPMRWAQLNLTEDDPAKMDVGFWLDYFKRIHADGTCLTAGGVVAFYPTKIPLHRWRTLVKAADWSSMDDVRLAAPNAKILNGERARFEIAGGNFRMIVAFDFRRRIAFIKFVGTHAEYDRIDALTVSIF